MSSSAPHVQRVEHAGTGNPILALLSPRLTLILTTAALAFSFFRFIWKYSVNIFYWDQWVFLTPFFQHSPGFKELFFEQWGPHREGIGLIADKALYPLTAWNTRAESFMIGGAIFLAMVLALILKRRLFGPWTYSDCAIPLIFLSLAQWSTLVETPNPAHAALPLLMILLYCIALLLRSQPLKYGVILCLNFLLIYTGFGVFMGVVTVGLFTLEFYWCWRHRIVGSARLAAVGFLLASASLASFFVHYKFWPAVDCFVFPYHPLTGYVSFLALLFWGVVGHPHHWIIGTVVGSLILLFVFTAFVTLVVRLLRADRPLDRDIVTFVLLCFSLLFALNTAVGRVCLGREGATVSRYVTLLIPAFLAVYFCLLSFSPLRVEKLGLALFVLLLIPSALAIRTGAKDRANGKRAWAACYLQTEDIRYCDESTHFKVDPYPEVNHLKEKLDYLKQHRLSLFAQQGNR